MSSREKELEDIAIATLTGEEITALLRAVDFEEGTHYAEEYDNLLGGE
jgi:hypothetical protein